MSRKSPAPELYRQDLAAIHVAGYGFHWEGAADATLGWLADAGVASGRVVDLGCGGGQWLARLDAEGYSAVGVDISAGMLKLAKRTAPKAKLLHGSFDQVELPECDAATSFGEPLNYLNSGPKLRRTLRNVYRALRPGGVFVFDVRHPSAKPVAPRDHVRQGDGWFCHALIEEQGASFKRQITTFTSDDGGTYRRDDETHRLKVFPRAEMTSWLREIGFRVRTRRGYDDYRLGPRQSVFICKKA